MGSEYTEKRGGYSGFFGSLMISFAFFSMIWALLDPATDFTAWTVLSVEYLGGLVLSMAFGFRLVKRVPLEDETNALILGVVGGIISSALSSVFLFFGQPFSTYEGVWLIMLAPVAEVLAFNIFVYHLIDFHFEESGFWAKAAPSDLAFAFFHWAAKGDDPLFWLYLIVFMVGNTVFMWLYDMTKNATAPFTAHYIINLIFAWNYVVPVLYAVLPIFILVFIGVVTLFIIFEVVLKR